MSTAGRLREAAALLREQAVPAVKGWGWRITDDRKWAVVVSSEGDVMAQVSDDDRAAYIATMHPGVALALADWLDVVAAWQDEGLGRVPGLDRTNWPDMWADVTREALAVADEILGGER